MNSVLHIVDACNGGMLDDAQFDTTGDSKVDKDDESFTGEEYDKMHSGQAILANNRYLDKDQVDALADKIQGLHYWRMFKD